MFKLWENVIRISDGKEYKIIEIDHDLPYSYKIWLYDPKFYDGSKASLKLRTKERSGIWVMEQMIKKI